MNKEKATKVIRFSNLRSIDSDNEEMIVEGYAVVFEKETKIGWYTEIIDKNAFLGTDMKDCSLKYNHSDNVVIMARTRNHSLELTPDSIGLKVRAILIDTNSNRDLYKSIKEGLLDRMSFSFTVEQEEWDYEHDVRRILKIDKLFDVSVVDLPAYDDTEVHARSKEAYQKEKDIYLRAKLEREKLKLLTMI